MRYILPLESVLTVTLAARGVDGYKAVPPVWARLGPPRLRSFAPFCAPSGGVV
jgi:hypothetical protein